MATLLTLVFFLSVKLLLIQAAYQYDDSRRTGQFFPDQINQMSNNEYPQVQPFRNDKQFRNTNTRYYDTNENVNIGNGYNKKNVVVIDERNPRNFDGGNVQSKPIPNGQQNNPNIYKPRTIDSIDNRYGNERELQHPNTNQGPINDLNNRRRNFFENPQFRDSSPGYHDDSEIVSIGNGHDRTNVVILDQSSRRNFQESTERAFLQPKYGIPNTNQRPRYVPNSRNINNIGNGQGNSNFVIIRDTADGLGRTVTTFPNGFPANSQVFVDKNPTYDNQRHNYPNTNNNNYGNYNRQNLNPPNSRNTYGNRETSNMDGTFTTYNKIGHGPENQNRVFINGELVNSNSDTTVLTRENNRRSDIFSIGGYSEDLKVLPLKKSK